MHIKGALQWPFNSKPGVLGTNISKPLHSTTDGATPEEIFFNLILWCVNIEQPFYDPFILCLGFWLDTLARPCIPVTPQLMLETCLQLKIVERERERERASKTNLQNTHHNPHSLLICNRPTTSQMIVAIA